MNTVLLYFFVVLLIAGGLNHVFNPKFYNRFIPDIFPKLAANYIAGAIEIVLGAGLLINGIVHRTAFIVFILMILFLPLHVIDVFRKQPAIGSRTLALIRLPLQFFLIWGAYWLCVHEI